MVGTWPIVKNVRLLRQALVDIETYGQPGIPGRARIMANGRVVAPVFPLKSVMMFDEKGH